MYPSVLTILAVLLCCVPSWAIPVQVAVKDANGAPLKSALIILQDLDHQERELTRVLTDSHGAAAMPELSPGLYRVISTYPYSRWDTTVREFLVEDKPVTVTVQMASMLGHDSVPISVGELTLHVLRPNGTPVAGARVLVRDAYADPHSEHWGTTDSQGTVSLTLTMQPALILVVDRDKLYDFPTAGLETERTLHLR